jgi:uncharacterized protein
VALCCTGRVARNRNRHNAASPVAEPADRERDASGRALNARPRDELGRPLPRGATGVPRIPEDAEYTPEEALALAQELLDRGLAFHAHEVFEAVWKSVAPEERWLWRSLAQLAVGITHVLRGNRAGAEALLRRASYGLAHPGTWHGVDGSALSAHARALADVLRAGDDPDPATLTPRLRASSPPPHPSSPTHLA